MKPECSLFFRATGLLLLIHELSVAAVADTAGGSGGGHGRQVILKEKAGKDYMRCELIVDDVGVRCTRECRVCRSGSEEWAGLR